jgi:DNA repair protein RecO (recombination protein O)
MEWRDEGLVLGVQRYGETGVIAELMTPRHGRHRGLVRGGASRRLRPILQPGNSVDVSWRARLDDQLGNYTVEGTVLRAGDVMAQASALDAVNMLGALLRLLPERDPHPPLYAAALVLVDRLTDDAVAPALMVRFELGILAELGFGLDLASCAATGTTDDLVYVSPKSGRAVSRSAGEPYRERLFALPSFLKGEGSSPPSAADLLACFALTGHFLMRDVFDPRGLPMPDSRRAYIDKLAKSSRAGEGGG